MSRERYFVGRERELADLVVEQEAAIHGRGSLTIVTGEPGVGKSRLLEEFAAIAAGRGMNAVWGRCLDEVGVPGYWVWRQVLGQLLHAENAAADSARSPSPVGEQLWAGWPEHDGALSVGPEAESPDGARFVFFEGVVRLLVSHARQTPLLIVLDDIHWADLSSLQLLQFIAANIARAPIQIAASYREVEARLSSGARVLLGGLARESYRIPLRGLGRDAVRSLIRETASAEPSDAMVETMHGMTEGNPFFIHEILRQWLAGGRQVSASDPALLRLEIPDQVREVIRQRLQPLGDDVYDLLGAAACVGSEFTTSLLAKVLDSDAGVVFGWIEQASKLGIVACTNQGSGAWRFTHALLREAIYEDLPITTRSALHHRIAMGLRSLQEEVVDDTLPLLAHHLLQALPVGDAEAAIDAAERAGRQALRWLAFERAATWFARAFEVAVVSAQPVSQRVWLLVAEAQAWHRAAASDASRQAIDHALRLARESSDPELFARTVLADSFMAAETGRINQRLIDDLREALRCLPTVDSSLRVGLLGRLAAATYFSSERAARIELCDTALAMARRLGDDEALSIALRSRHFAIWGPGTAAERLETATELLALGEKRNDRDAILEARDWRCVDLLELGDLRAMREELECYEATAERLQNPRSRWHARLVHATLALFCKPLAEAETAMTEAFELGQRVKAANALQFYAVQRFTLHLERQQLREFEGSVRRLIDQYPALPVWRCAVAFLYAELGALSDAARELESLMAASLTDVPMDSNWLISMTLIAETIARLGDRDKAAQAYAALQPYEHENAVIGTAAGCYGSVARPLSVLALTLENFPDALAHARLAAEANQRMGSPLWTGYAWLAEVAVPISLTRSSGCPIPEWVSDRLSAIEATAVHLGATRLLARVRGARKYLVEADAEHLPRAGSMGTSATAPRLQQSDNGVWVASYRGRTTQLRDLRGLHYLQKLLSAPRRQFHVVELYRRGDSGDGSTSLSKLALHIEKLRAFREQLSLAEEDNDVGKVEALRQEIASGLHALALTADSGASDELERVVESTRVAVTKAIGVALAAIAKFDPDLRQHLGSAVHTGRICLYDPGR